MSAIPEPQAAQPVQDSTPARVLLLADVDMDFNSPGGGRARIKGVRGDLFTVEGSAARHFRSAYADAPTPTAKFRILDERTYQHAVEIREQALAEKAAAEANAAAEAQAKADAEARAKAEADELRDLIRGAVLNG